jgi:YgiT-type zinc finger domain-containing protein
LDRLAKPESNVIDFDSCPICGGELQEKEVEKLVRGGTHSALLHVQAQVCLRCGERLYSLETIEQFETVREKLAKNQVAGLEPIGRFFNVASG